MSQWKNKKCRYIPGDSFKDLWNIQVTTAKKYANSSNESSLQAQMASL